MKTQWSAQNNANIQVQSSQKLDSDALKQTIKTNLYLQFLQTIVLIPEPSFP